MLLKELRLQTMQLSALSHFYADILELPVTKEDDAISIKTGNSQIIFEETKSKDPFYHFAFNIPANKFEEALQWTQKKVKLLWLDDYNGYVADFTNWHAKSFYFLDPAGNILEFIARFDLNDEEHEPFLAAHIRNISEIGLVFSSESFDSNVDKLFKQYPLCYFDKQPPLPHFRAVGSDEGLFIIVPENRTWFSTRNTMSEIFPMKILFEVNKNPYELDL